MHFTDDLVIFTTDHNDKKCMLQKPNGIYRYNICNYKSAQIRIYALTF